MRAKDIEIFADLTDTAEAALIEAARRLKLSPRGYHRTIKLARTIADLAGARAIEPPHMLEALQYRAREF
jgi:magnesium chelatase family protein